MKVYESQLPQDLIKSTKKTRQVDSQDPSDIQLRGLSDGNPGR